MIILPHVSFEKFNLGDSDHLWDSLPVMSIQTGAGPRSSQPGVISGWSHETYEVVPVSNSHFGGWFLVSKRILL
ncbi:hypothetical protein NPIL_673981, partial [Nephila pilipes]